MRDYDDEDDDRDNSGSGDHVALPSAPEHERDVIAACLFHGDAWFSQVVAQGGEQVIDLFHRSEYRTVAEAMVKLHDSGQVVNPTNVIDKITAMGYATVGPHDDIPQFVRELPLTVTSLSTLDELSAAVWVLSDVRTRRKIIRYLDTMQADAYELDEVTNQDLFDQAREMASDIGLGTVKLAPSMLDEVVEVSEPTFRISTGFAELDAVLDGGYGSGQFYVVLGSTKSGKSSYVMSGARRAAENGAAVLVVTLELTKSAMRAGILASQYGLDVKLIRRWLDAKCDDSILTEAEPEDEELVSTARESLKNFTENPIHMLDDMDIRRSGDLLSVLPMHIIALKDQYPDKDVVVFLDYLQHGIDRNDNAYRQVGDRSDKLSRFAKTYNVPIISAVQASTSVQIGTMPGPLDSAENNYPARDAHATLGVNVPSHGEANNMDDIMQIAVLLQRSGPGRTIDCRFIPSHGILMDDAEERALRESDDDAEEEVVLPPEVPKSDQVFAETAAEPERHGSERRMASGDRRKRREDAGSGDDKSETRTRRRRRDEDGGSRRRRRRGE